MTCNFYFSDSEISNEIFFSFSWIVIHNTFIFLSAVNMIFDSIDDLRCLENISNEEDYTRNALFEDKQLHALLEVSMKEIVIISAISTIFVTIVCSFFSFMTSYLADYFVHYHVLQRMLIFCSERFLSFCEISTIASHLPTTIYSWNESFENCWKYWCNLILR